MFRYSSEIAIRPLPINWAETSPNERRSPDGAAANGSVTAFDLYARREDKILDERLSTSVRQNTRGSNLLNKEIARDQKFFRLTQTPFNHATFKFGT